MPSELFAIRCAEVRSQFVSLNDLCQICVKFVPQSRPMKTSRDKVLFKRTVTKTLFYKSLSWSGVVWIRPLFGGARRIIIEPIFQYFRRMGIRSTRAWREYSSVYA